MNLVKDLMSGDYDSYNEGEVKIRPFADMNYDDQVNIQDIVKMQREKVNQYVDPSTSFQRRPMGFQEGGEVDARRPKVRRFGF